MLDHLFQIEYLTCWKMYICAYQWVNERKTKLHCEHTGVASFLHSPFDVFCYIDLWCCLKCITKDMPYWLIQLDLIVEQSTATLIVQCDMDKGSTWWYQQMEPLLCNGPFLKEGHWWPVNSLHKGPLMWILDFLWFTRTSRWTSNGIATYLRSRDATSLMQWGWNKMTIIMLMTFSN